MKAQKRELTEGIFDDLYEVSDYLSKLLSRKDWIYFFIFGLLATLAGGYVFWLEGKPLVFRVFGYMGFIVILLFIAVAASVFQKEGGYRWIVSRYEKRFSGFPPLCGVLFAFKPDYPLSTRRLLRTHHSIIVLAFSKEGISLDDQENYPITRGCEESYSPFLRKTEFYDQINNYIERDIGDISWFTGEFGSLKDQKFLDALKACKHSTASIIGYLEGNPSKIDEALDILYKINIKEEKSPYNQLGTKKQEKKALVKQLVESKKLSLFVTPHRLDGLHVARIGDSVLIQQRHDHHEDLTQAPVAVIQVKDPTENLKRFVNGYLERIKKLPLTKLK